MSINIDYSKVKTFSMSAYSSGKCRVRFKDLEGRQKLIALKNSRSEAIELLNTLKNNFNLFKLNNQGRKDNEHTSGISNLLRSYIKHKTEDDLKEVKTIESYFSRFVLNFFLYQNNLKLNDWHKLYSDFIKYLEEEVISKKKGPLSRETTRKICFYMNDFFSWTYSQKLISETVIPIKIPKAIDNFKDLEDAYWTTEEFEKLLSRASDELKDVVTFLYFTGMRSNELASISRNNYFLGQISEDSIHVALKKSNFMYIGFICLEGQLESIRGDVYTIKPLKSKQSIDPRFNRYIPVSPELYEVIKRRNDLIVKRKKIAGYYKINLLFPDYDPNLLNFEMKEICRQIKVPERTLHSLRHTAATNFYSAINRDEQITRMITGHESSNVFRRYLHLIQKLSVNVKKNNNDLLP